MDEFFSWKALLKALILPPAAPLILALAGLALTPRHRQLGRSLTVLGVGLLFVLSLPVVAVALARWVDESPVPDAAAMASAQAIVVLGGGIRRDAPEYGTDTMNSLTLERVRYTAWLARLTRLPILVSGGSVSGRTVPEATLMRAALQDEYGVPVRWVETRSRNTRENAQMSAALLRADGIRRVLLVGHSFDLPRTTAEFAAEGVETIAAPTRLPPRHAPALLDFVPSAAALQGSYYATPARYALAWRRVAR